jgi:hypothetical protein
MLKIDNSEHVVFDIGTVPEHLLEAFLEQTDKAIHACHTSLLRTHATMTYPLDLLGLAG